MNDFLDRIALEMLCEDTQMSLLPDRCPCGSSAHEPEISHDGGIWTIRCPASGMSASGSTLWDANAAWNEKAWEMRKTPDSFYPYTRSERRRLRSEDPESASRSPRHYKSAKGHPYLYRIDDRISLAKWGGSDEVDPPTGIATLGEYYGTPGLRKLSHAVKRGDRKAIEEAGRLIYDNLIDESDGAGITLVPMPSRTGIPTMTTELANAIARRGHDIRVEAVLRGSPHESLYDYKKEHGTENLPPLGMKKSGRLTDSDPNPSEWSESGYRKVYLVDNVVDTAHTYLEAEKAVPGAGLLAIAHTENTPKRLLLASYGKSGI